MQGDILTGLNDEMSKQSRNAMYIQFPPCSHTNAKPMKPILIKYNLRLCLICYSLHTCIYSLIIMLTDSNDSGLFSWISLTALPRTYFIVYIFSLLNLLTYT